MRYVIQTEDAEGIIGMQINKWQKEAKLTIIEKSDTIVEIENNLRRVASALEILKKVGYDSEVMQIYLMKKTGSGAGTIHDVLFAQKDFLKKIGAMK